MDEEWRVMWKYIKDDKDLFAAEPGVLVGPDDRYTIIGLHHSIKHALSAQPHATYVAEDKRLHKTVILKVLGKSQSSYLQVVGRDQILRDKLRQLENANQHLLLPLDWFEHTTEDARYGCLVYELYGPSLCELTQHPSEPLPDNWIWKVFHEAILALTLLHKNDTVHGTMELLSLVITYPKIDPRDKTAVNDLYTPPGMFCSNASGSGSAESPHNLDFALKLQEFSRSFMTTEGIDDASRCILFECPPPEVLLDNQVGTPADIWYLAGIIANFVAGGLLGFDSIVGRGKDAWKALKDAEKVLGPLPDRYAKHYGEKLPFPTAQDTGPQLLEALRKHRKFSLRDESPDDDDSGPEYDSKPFSDEEVRLVADLLVRMLDYDPDKRYTAKQVLDHKFFKIARPA